jgi:hypothetical protein
MKEEEEEEKEKNNKKKKSTAAQLVTLQLPDSNIMNWQTAKFVLLMPVRTPRPAPPPP